MKRIHFISTLALLALPVVALAQPDPNNAPKANNPVNRAVGGGRNRLQIQNATPEQRQALMRTAFKRQLTRANITNVAQQDAITDYVLAEAEARTKLEEATRTLQTGMRNTTVTDAQVAGLLNEYNATVADDKDRHEKALTKLKAAIDVTQYPRLEAMLTLAGVYGDSHAPTGNLVSLLGGNARNFRTNVTTRATANGAAANGAAAGRGNALNRRNNRNVPF